jgi:urease accessory protein
MNKERMVIRTLARIGGGAALASLSYPALAHTGLGETSGFMSGLMHPLSGLDHMLAMVAVGVLAARLGGRALWLLPASFLLFMGIGGSLGLHGIDVPGIEVGIAASVVVFGMLIMMPSNFSTTAAIAVAGFFAVFHGHAHGAEMPIGSSIAGYAAGFTVATAFLHAVGLGAGTAIARLDDARAKWVQNLGGAAMALTGVAILAQTL